MTALEEELVTSLDSALASSQLQPLVRFALEDLQIELEHRYRDDQDAGMISEEFDHGSQQQRSLFDTVSDSLLRLVWAEKRRNGLEVDGFVRGNRREVYGKIVAASSVKQICETGFNFGYSSLLFLLANARAHVHSFDLLEEQQTHKRAGLDFMQALFPNRLTVVAGNTSETLERYFSSLSSGPAICDIVHVDGGHFFDQPEWELRTLSRFSVCRAIVFMDDVGSCPYCEAAQRAWNNARKSELLTLRACYDTTINETIVSGIDEGHRFCVGRINSNC